VESQFNLNIFIKLYVYKAVENGKASCDDKCTHVDKNGLKLFFRGYAQKMLSFIRGCEQFIGVIR